MRIITYIFSGILMCASMWMAPVHLKTIPNYFKLKLNNFYTLLGLFFSLLTILSIIISICTFINPNPAWFLVTLFFILANIWSWIYMMKNALKDTGQPYHEEFNKELRIVRVTLYSELLNEFKQHDSGIDAELSGTLSARVVNHLMGEDNDLSYQEADTDTKRKIDRIKDKVVSYAENKLKKDFRTREVVVYTLRMRLVLRFAAEEKYSESREYERISAILKKYGEEFPKEANPTMYKQIVMNYHKERFVPKS